MEYFNEYVENYKAICYYSGYYNSIPLVGFYVSRDIVYGVKIQKDKGFKFGEKGYELQHFVTFLDNPICFRYDMSYGMRIV